MINVYGGRALQRQGNLLKYRSLVKVNGWKYS